MPVDVSGKRQITIICVQVIFLIVVSACSGPEEPTSTAPPVNATLISARQTIEAAAGTIEASKTPSSPPPTQRKTPEPVPVVEEGEQLSDYWELPDPRSIDIVGDIAYIAYAEGNADSGLLTVDISDPTRPTILQDMRTGSSPQSYVSVRDNVAYLTIFGGVLYAIDVSNPRRPVILDSYSTGELTSGMELYWNFAFLPIGDAGISIVDVSDPGDLKLISEYTPTWRGKPYVSNVFIHDDVAFVALDDSALKIMDINDLYDVHEIGSLDFPADVKSIKFVDDTAFIGTSFSEDGGVGVHVFDIHDPWDPEQIAYVELPSINFMQLVDNLLFVESGASSTVDGGLYIIDVTRPDKPVQLGHHRIVGIEGMEIIDDMAIIVTSGGMQLLDISDPKNPRPVGFNVEPTPTPIQIPTTIPSEINIFVNEVAHIPGSGAEEILTHLGAGLIDKDGDYVYVLSSVEGLKIFDVKNPFAPKIVAAYNDLHDPSNLEVDGGVAYIGDGSGITMLDISDPPNPRRIGRLRTDVGGTFRLWNQRLYFGGGQRVEVFDISNPEESEKLYDIDMLERVNGIQIDREKERLFVFMGNDLLQVFDANYLDSLHLQQPVNVSHGNDYLMQDLMLYETAPGLLRVFSAEDDNHLEMVGTYGESQYQSGYEQVADIEGIKVQDGLAYIADYRNGLYIIDVSNPERMYVRGFYYPGELWWARDVEIDGNLVYLGSDDGGLRVLMVNGTGIPTPIPTEPVETPSSKRSDLGGKIVFLSDRDQPGDFFADVELYMMSADGSDQRRIAPGAKFPYYSSVVVSPDGQTIAVGVVNGDPAQKGLHLYDSTGLSLEFVDTNGRGVIVHSWTIDNEPLISLHEPKTTFGNLYIFEIDSHIFRQLTDSKQRLVFGSQSPTGKSVAYMQYVPDNDGNPQLWLMESDGSGKRSLTTEGALSMAWSPDGEYVVYETNNPTGHLRLATIDADTISSFTPIIKGNADHEPNWSPDSQSVVYAHTENNSGSNPGTQIHVIDRTTERDVQLTSDGNNYDPFWVP